MVLQSLTVMTEAPISKEDQSLGIAGASSLQAVEHQRVPKCHPIAHLVVVPGNKNHSTFTALSYRRAVARAPYRLPLMAETRNRASWVAVRACSLLGKQIKGRQARRVSKGHEKRCTLRWE